MIPFSPRVWTRYSDVRSAYETVVGDRKDRSSGVDNFHPDDFIAIPSASLSHLVCSSTHDSGIRFLETNRLPKSVARRMC